MPPPPDAKTEIALLSVSESPLESWISNFTVYVPDALNACCAVRVVESEVSHAPSDSQSQRACKVALGSESVEVDASNVIVSFTDGTVGEYVNRAVGPAAVIVTATGAVWASAPLVPVIVTVYVPEFVPLRVQVDVWVPLMLDGAHDVVTPAGAEDAVSATVPVNPLAGGRGTVEVADRPARNETLAGFAESGKSGPAGSDNSGGHAVRRSPCA